MKIFVQIRSSKRSTFKNLECSNQEPSIFINLDVLKSTQWDLFYGTFMNSEGSLIKINAY